MRIELKCKLSGAGKIALGVGASAGLGWLAVRGLDWGVVRDSLEDVSPSLLLLSVAIFMFASYLRALRWRVLFLDDQVSAWRLFVVQNEGIGLNNVVPIRVVGEPTQIAVLSYRDGIKTATAVATLGMERAIDVVASTLILAVAFFLVPEMRNFTLFVWGAVGFAIAMVVALRLVAWGTDAWSFIHRFSFVSAFAVAVRDLVNQPVRLALSMSLSVLYWLLVGVTAWLVAKSVDLPISPMTATLVIMATIFFATTVPAAPSAIGTFEFAVIYVLEYFDVTRESSFGFAVLTHVVFFLPPTIIAAVFLPREGIVSLSRIRGLATRGSGVEGVRGQA